ncbi:MAG: hypothetical protein GXP54_06025 [Deltaproteobacteria bacterium]|nr:hypothetical protein [Deltaproteobacteria bacterium]
MADDYLKGILINTGGLEDFRVFGPTAAEDTSLLAKTPLIGFLSWIAYTRGTGSLAVSAGGADNYELVVKDGSLVTLQRTGLAFIDEVMNHLVANDVISADAGARAQSEAEASGHSVLQTLFETGACTPRALVEGIRVTKQGMLDALIDLPEAAYEWRSGAKAVKATDPVTIDFNLFLVKLARTRTRSAYFSEISPFLSDYMGRYPMKSDRLTPAIAGVALTDKERRVLEEISDGTITLKEVMSLSLLSRNMTARLYLISMMLGFVEFRMTPLPRGGIEALELELERTLERVHGEDHFTRLEIHWTSHPSRIQAAYDKMVKRYGPGNKVRRQSEKAAQLCDRILGLMKDSLDALGDQEGRRRYRREIMDETKLNFGTDFLFKQAHLAKFRGQIDKAREIIESAIDIHPKQQFVNFRRTLG